MYQLIYGSTATKDMTEADILQILETSRRNNGEKNITGLLLYKDGNFLQVLEGEKQLVKDLAVKIAKDERHRNMMIYVQREIEAREFSDWSMGFRNLNKFDVKSLDGYSPILEFSFMGQELKENPTYATAFINAFKNI